ncbi:hypothetical protein PVL29_002614 [Vitis rotundifolia]|uniref:Uncharacterized protein n=1 Tax=Vitis rotundifolia TaxID=103349 RepID=A0AA39AIE9_VITRO|nr:hypothetical protein PVL29_002614 [Vitis rotundifolia]
MANFSTPHYQNSRLCLRGNHVKVENYSEERMRGAKAGNKPWPAKLIQRHRREHRTQEVHQLGFSYLASSLRYFLSKAKAFYNRFFLEAIDNPMGRTEVMLVDPYFSFPVVPATTFAPF